MKGVKTILAFGLGAAYASAWWQLPLFGRDCGYSNGRIPALATAVLGISCIGWLVINWDEK